MYQVANLQLDLDMDFTLRIDENVTVFLDVEKLDVKMMKTNKETFPNNPWNATVSTSTFLLPAELAAVTKTAEFAINSLFTDGLELEPLIEKNVPWLNLTELELATGDGWL